MLGKMEQWKFDAFELWEASNGRPLSLLAFALLTKGGVLPQAAVKLFNKKRLARCAAGGAACAQGVCSLACMATSRYPRTVC